MGLWDDAVLPRLIDAACGSPDVRPLRERACAGLTGTVVELGFGSGHNCGLYPDAVSEVLAVEPSDRAWALSEKRRAASPANILRAGLDGQRLDLPDASADTVLITFTLCTIPHADAALGEVVRVLRPGGTVHIAEHGHAPDRGVARWQRRLDPLQQRVFGGCHLTRDPRSLLDAAGFTDLDLETGYVRDTAPMRPWMYGFSGTARRPAA